MILTVKIKDRKDAEQLVFAASQIKRDVWISSTRGLFSAKSMLGLYSVLNDSCCLIINDEDYNDLAMNLNNFDIFGF